MSFYFGFLHESKKHDLSLMNLGTFINQTVLFENKASEAILLYHNLFQLKPILLEYGS